jgi:hypothetical protein
MDIQPLHTKIDKTIQLTTGVLVLESSIGYPRGESNLYQVAPNGKILWKAEAPEGNTYFSRVKLNDDGETLKIIACIKQVPDSEAKVKAERRAGLMGRRAAGHQPVR